VLKLYEKGVRVFVEADFFGAYKPCKKYSSGKDVKVIASTIRGRMPLMHTNSFGRAFRMWCGCYGPAVTKGSGTF